MSFQHGDIHANPSTFFKALKVKIKHRCVITAARFLSFFVLQLCLKSSTINFLNNCSIRRKKINVPPKYRDKNFYTIIQVASVLFT